MASYFQSYFQASSMPKRLLQYALSRLEILDTDALDLENLDITFGKNSTFEFRDVGLRLNKLESLLQLPPSFQLLQSRVSLLRLTIPVDIYSSPISVEVDGVECHLCVKSQNEKGPTKSGTYHDRVSKRSRSSRTRTQSQDIDAEESETEIKLPTAADLAESFLQTAPDGEKAELETAILSETQDFGRESVLSEDGELPVGTGTALSLPAFMTGFLQGIVDRLQVRISGVTFNLDVGLPNESSKDPIANPTDIVTFQVRIDHIDVEGVTHQLGNTVVGDGAGQKPPSREGMRLVSLSEIRGSLISEASFFSGLARSSALSSPSTTHRDTFHDSRAHSKASSAYGTDSVKLHESFPKPDSVSSSSHELPTPVAENPSSSGFLAGSPTTSDQGRFDDAPEDETRSNLSASVSSESELSESVLQNSVYLDQVSESQYNDDEEEQQLGSTVLSTTSGDTTPQLQAPKSPASVSKASIELQSSAEEHRDMSKSLSTSKSQISTAGSFTLPARPRFSQGRVSQSQISLPPNNETFTRSDGLASSHTTAGTAATHDSDDSDDSSNGTPVGEENLAQSQIFSHEEAESMYMSALSGGTSRSVAHVPGKWNDSSSGSDGTTSSQGSPPTSRNSGAHKEWVASSTIVQPVSNLVAISQGSTGSLDSAEGSRKVPPSLKLVPQEHYPSVVPQAFSTTSEPSTTSSEEYSSKVSKPLLHLDRIDIYLPAGPSGGSTNPPTDVAASSMLSSSFDGQNDQFASTSINVPGAFSSIYSSERTPKSSAPSSQKPYEVPVADTVAQAVDSSIEIALGQLKGQFDASVARLLFRLTQHILGILGKEPAIPAKAVETDPIDLKLRVKAEEVSLKFVERLEGTLISSRSRTEPGPWKAASEADVLLKTALKGLQIDTQMMGLTSKTSLRLKKFIFGYAQENIISFDAGLQMRASVRDLRASEGIDVSATITRTEAATRLEVMTLPLHVSIDLQRLDETFSWFGGLSSVLNLGSSIASNATVTAISPRESKPRGVRFEAPIRPEDKSIASQNKADLRLGGFVLDLVGTECSIGVETSAVKIVNRDEGMGVSVQKIRLSGPHLKRANEEPAINVEVTNTRIEYLASPKDVDLDRLLSLITPSKAKYDEDDDILLDTLLRQRKQGPVLRLTIDNVQARIGRLGELSYLPELGEEVSRLATVAKYLPEDDRPGLLSLVMLHKFDAQIDVNNSLGSLQLTSTGIEIAQITLPALVALSVGTVSARRNASEDLLGAVGDPELQEPRLRSPAIMARMIGDEMEPTIKVKLWNLKVEYRVPTLMVILGLATDASSQDLSASLSASVATLTDFARRKDPRGVSNAGGPVSASNPSSKPMNVDIAFRDCVLGLNPLGLPSKLLVVLTEAHLIAALPKDDNANASFEINKASLLVVDDITDLITGPSISRPRRQSFDGGSSQVADLCATGFVSVGYISSAKAILQMNMNESDERCIDIELRDDLFVLETCADSTQTLIATLNGLSPPAQPAKETKYRTKVIPVHDLLASLSGDAFGTAEGDYNFDQDFGEGEELGLGDFLDEEADDDGIDGLEFDSQFYQNEDNKQYDEAVSEAMSGSIRSARLTTTDTQDGVLLESILDSLEPSQDNEPLEFEEDHFGQGSILEGTAHQWNSSKNTYDKSNLQKVRKSPLKVCVRDVHIIWNLFDGYDWHNTRDKISKAVQDVESKAIEKRARNERRSTFDQDIEDEETVIGDFLFNSIYIGIPGNRDPRELSAAINQELNDNATETESIATTSLSSSPSRQSGTRGPKSRKLRLKRSKHHKITFELRGVSVDMVVFPPGSGETQSSIDVRVHDLEIFDHVPTSTWKLFASYMQEAGERETGSNMVHIEILNVKPIPDLAAAEIVLKVTVLPLRLHVDQDALDFITRFFEFKDDSIPTSSAPGEAPFLQRAEVNSVQVKLDFKPKRVDYAGIRSGHTTEFMNFLILEEADMVLRHTIIYGISGFDKLGKCLNDIWMPEIKRNQLPGILAGLAPVRSLVNVGGGFRHLVVVPMREYKKDGRIVRSISKGAAAFAKTTGTELVKLGAKVAIGVQTVLQGAEGFLGPTDETFMSNTDEDDSEEGGKRISPYANQPVGVMQGLRGGYSGLQRDLVLARDAIIAVPGEVMEGGNAAGVLRAVRKHAPTVILRPAIGVAKAGGQILMGATNALDPSNLQRVEAKYKKH